MSRLRAGDELGALAADGDELGRGLDVGDELEEVGVERTAEALVGRDEEDAAGLDLALSRGTGGDSSTRERERREHVGHELGVGPAGEREPAAPSSSSKRPPAPSPW
jgi:hypothetical protein